VATLPDPAAMPELPELPEQPASSKPAPDISTAHAIAVVRSGPCVARARTVVFMPLGRARCVPGSRPGQIDA
jgi:hypothetical protein